MIPIVLLLLIPNVKVYDEKGKEFYLHDLPKKFIFVPLWLDCPTTCPVIVSSLKSLNLKENVVIFSIKEENVEKLKEFHKRFDLNDWKVVSAKDEDIKKVLEYLNYKVEYITTTGEYIHPNWVFIVYKMEPKSVVKGYIFHKEDFEDFPISTPKLFAIIIGIFLISSIFLMRKRK